MTRRYKIVVTKSNEAGKHKKLKIIREKAKYLISNFVLNIKALP